MTRAPFSRCCAGLLASSLTVTLGCGDVTSPASEELAEPGPNDAAYDVALAFDGVDDYASVGTGRAPQIMRDQSVLLWFQAEPGASGGSEGLQALFTMRRSDGSGWVISLDDGVPLAFNVYAEKTLARAPMLVTTADWHHLAFVISEESSRLYVDGAEVGAGARPATNRTPTHGFIGSSDGYRQMFHGSLDELRFYDRAVSADEIARAAAGDAPDADADADSLVIYLPFDEASGARSFDRSGLGNHAQLGDGVPQLMPERIRSGVPR